MNTLLKPLTLVAIFFFAASLKSGQKTDASRFKSDGYFTASIDGSAFDTRSYDRYTAEVTNESDYAKGEKSTDLTFYAGNHYDQNGNLFEESLQFKYALTASTIGDALGQRLYFSITSRSSSAYQAKPKLKLPRCATARIKPACM